MPQTESAFWRCFIIGGSDRVIRHTPPEDEADPTINIPYATAEWNFTGLMVRPIWAYALYTGKLVPERNIHHPMVAQLQHKLAKRRLLQRRL